MVRTGKLSETAYDFAFTCESVYLYSDIIGFSVFKYPGDPIFIHGLLMINQSEPDHTE